MSSITIITAIIVLLAVLVCYAFVAQTVAQKRQQRERLSNALKTRVRNFKFMLNNLPAGFLPKELTLLIQRSLIQVLEQLVKLDTKDGNHAQDLKIVAQQMAETQRQPPQSSASPPLDNPQKAQEVKACLEELYKFIFQLEGKKGMTRPQANVYRNMIKQLVLQLTVDGYVLHGRIAKEKEKFRLAAHYFDLALKLMQREGNNGQFDGRIKQLQNLIAELQNLDGGGPLEAEAEIEEDNGKENINEQWDKFEKEANWKKKQIYD